jgi:hypothetical protein
VAVREYVRVTMADMAARIDDGLLLRVVGRSGLVAVCDAWEISSQDAVGILNLNTAELVEDLEDLKLAGARKYKLVVWSLADQEMIGDGWINIRVNPAGDGETELLPLAKWGTDLTDVNNALEGLESLLAAHTHDGGESAQISHSDLLDKGNMTHAQLEAAMGNLQAAIDAHGDRLAALESWRAAVSATVNGLGDQVAALGNWRLETAPEVATLISNVQTLQNQMAAVNAITPVDLGWTVGAGTTLRALSGDGPSYGELLKVVRTLVSDLKARGVI